MSSLCEEISNLTITLSQLEEERRNLLKHFQIQEENYAFTFKNYENKVDLLLKQKEEQVEKICKEKCLLEGKLVSYVERTTVL